MYFRTHTIFLMAFSCSDLAAIEALSHSTATVLHTPFNYPPLCCTSVIIIELVSSSKLRLKQDDVTAVYYIIHSTSNT
jgi:hypothetical protein